MVRGWVEGLRRLVAVDDADRAEPLRLLEDLKNAAASAQAVTTVGLVASTRDKRRAEGVPARRLDAGIASDVGLARRESPHRAAQHVGLAFALLEMPWTAAATACSGAARRSGGTGRPGHRGAGAWDRLRAGPGVVHEAGGQGREGSTRHAAAGSRHHGASQRAIPRPRGRRRLRSPRATRRRPSRPTTTASGRRYRSPVPRSPALPVSREAPSRMDLFYRDLLLTA